MVVRGRQYIHDDGGRSLYYIGDTGDCVVRAIAIFTGLDYKEVYNNVWKICEHSPRNGLLKTETRKVMKAYGLDWHPTMQIGQGCKVHFNPEELPRGKLILQLAGHVVCAIDGIPHDTWDSSKNGKACVYGYWYKT